MHFIMPVIMHTVQQKNKKNKQIQPTNIATNNNKHGLQTNIAYLMVGQGLFQTPLGRGGEVPPHTFFSPPIVLGIVVDW